jgi:hypothetical protein
MRDSNETSADDDTARSGYGSSNGCSSHLLVLNSGYATFANGFHKPLSHLIGYNAIHLHVPLQCQGLHPDALSEAGGGGGGGANSKYRGVF